MDTNLDGHEIKNERSIQKKKKKRVHISAHLN